MTNTASNLFVIIVGFLLLGFPIIMISMSTAPPSPMEFQSTINFNTIVGDSQSGVYLNDTSPINGSSLYYWDDIQTLSELSYINNITELVISEHEFMENVSIDDYVGFSKEVHVFILEITIKAIPLETETKTAFLELFGSSNGTFQTNMIDYDNYQSFYYNESSYPAVNDSIEAAYGHLGIAYLVTVTFYANIDIDGVQMTTSFSRLLILENTGTLLFFICNEEPWTTIS